MATPLLSVEEALARVLADAKPLPSVEVPLVEAHGRVLASDLAARRTQPPDAVSAMDGYAVLANDLATAPATLNVVGEVAAGKPFDRAIKSGEAARIFTGGVVPQGADAVVVQEQSIRDGDKVTLRNVTAAGKNIRPKGLDFKEGEVLFGKGRRLLGREVRLSGLGRRVLGQGGRGGQRAGHSQRDRHGKSGASHRARAFFGAGSGATTTRLSTASGAPQV